ncbi:LacI family DNA-binding transcriptional regulator [Caproiciproducens sp. LBM24188]
MAKHKVSMRDIAKECNVSVATVSYVLNHSENEKIGHDTCLKITEAATRLHYKPRDSVKKRKSNQVGVVINFKDNDSAGKRMCYYDLASKISVRMKELGFETLVIETKDPEKDMAAISRHNFNAFFLIDIDNKVANKITQHYYVPILFLNCNIHDSLFCKIYPDYKDAIRKAKAMLSTNSPILVMEDICNEDLKNQIIGGFPPHDVFINTSSSSLRLFLQNHRQKKAIVLGDILGLETELYINRQDLVVVSNLDETNLLLPDTKRIYFPNRKVADIAVQTLQKMFSLDYGKAGEENRILVSCELD